MKWSSVRVAGNRSILGNAPENVCLVWWAECRAHLSLAVVKFKERLAIMVGVFFSQLQSTYVKVGETYAERGTERGLCFS